VAVDAAGVPGGRTFSYHVPDRLGDVAAGEVVLVEYGRTRAIGVVLGEGHDPRRDTKPLLDRVRAGGPLLPEIGARLARFIAEHYLAPPGMVVRQMLAPGALERIELVANATEARDEAEDPRLEELLQRLRSAGDPGVAVTELSRETGRATVMRRLRALEDARLARLEWRQRPAAVRPRVERRVRLTATGALASDALRRGERPDGRPLGPRQQALLLELAGQQGPDTDVPAAARLAERFGGSAVSGLAKRGLVVLETAEVARRPLEGRAPGNRGAIPEGFSISPAQQEAIDQVTAAIREREPKALLLEGVTASGKTGVYAKVVEASLAAGRGSIVLVPEIALALPLLDRLRHDLGIEPALLHSGLSDGERADEWRRIRADPAPLVVGTRLAILAPVADPGVIVVDEEHDPAYKSDRTPRYHARDVALELGRLARAPVILGSATPDLVSVGRARLGELDHVHLHERQAGAVVPVQVVDLRAELAEGNRGLLSAPLVAALESLDRDQGDRAVLVINRRGSASVVVCRDCGYVQICPECQRPLVFHAASMALRCHHCGATAPVARRCPACGSGRIRYLGGGTERVEREIRVRLPQHRVARLDRDVAERRGAAAAVIDAFTDGRLDVLVGTSLVAKGLDVPEVTLVGVVSADVALNLPDERATERTWQLLAQAVGRAGRGTRPGIAFIQTYLPDHPAIQAVATGDSSGFVESELERRRRFGSPPWGALVKLTIALEDRSAAEDGARRLAAELRERSVGQGTEVLGPVPAYVARRGGRWRFHLVLRGRDPLGVLGGDPGAPWSIDVDPESLL
jgi:primosomal protein N' (replication factor Y)